MTAKNSIKTRHSISGLTFDDDLLGLYKPEQVTHLLGKKVRFLAPSVIQKALMIKFLVLALQDLVTTESERLVMPNTTLYINCMNKLKEINISPKSQEETQNQQLILGKMFANPDANEYLIAAIRQSFPDLDSPEKLTDEAFMEAATELIKAMNINEG